MSAIIFPRPPSDRLDCARPNLAAAAALQVNTKFATDNDTKLGAPRVDNQGNPLTGTTESWWADQAQTPPGSLC